MTSDVIAWVTLGAVVATAIGTLALAVSTRRLAETTVKSVDLQHREFEAAQVAAWPELGFALAEHAFGLLSDRINSLPVTADPVEDLVAAAVLGFRAFVLEHPDLFRLVSSWELVCSSVHRLRGRRRPR